MKYEKIDSGLFIENRLKFSDKLKSNSIAVFNSNDIMPTSADGMMAFKQHTDIFYLCGIDQEESILILFPDHPDKNLRELLFLKETSKEIEIWEGHKYTRKEAFETSGIKNVFWLNEFEQLFKSLIIEADHVYLNTNEHLRASTEVETRDDRFIKWCKKEYPLHEYERLAPIMHDLRSVKSEIEIELLRKACQITEQGFRRLLKFIKPGVWEYEIEAELIHEFISNRSDGFAYAPIIASGGNACVLHYIQNNDVCRENELILLDIGARYANYNADLTRTIPVSGRYSQRQKDVYNAVLRVQKVAMSMLTPGNTIAEYHKEVGLVMQKELVGLGLLSEADIKDQDPRNPSYKKYFMHGTSHHLGLDVHDYGSIYKPFEVGMVLTVEPGIYINEENLGVRIENNVVIREHGLEDLMSNIPVEIDEIEQLMNE